MKRHLRSICLFAAVLVLLTAAPLRSGADSLPDEAVVVSTVDTVAAAKALLAAVPAALSAYVAAGGYSTDSVYKNVNAAKALLQRAVLVSAPNTDTVQSLSASLQEKLNLLESARQVLISALSEAVALANLQLSASAAAQTDYLAAGGLASDILYRNVGTAASVLSRYLQSALKKTSLVVSYTSALKKSTSLMEAAAILLRQTPEEARAAALDAFGAAADSQISYISAGGLATDAVYKATSTAINALQNELAAAVFSKPRLQAATTTLLAKTSLLDTATTAAIKARNDAITAAQAAISKGLAGAEDYVSAGGLITDAVCASVLTAVDVVKAALAAEPAKTTLIKSATAALSGKTTALIKVKDALLRALAAAITSAKASAAKANDTLAAFLGAGGSANDETAVQLKAATDELLLAVDNTASTKAVIISLTAAVNAKAAALKLKLAVLQKALAELVKASNLLMSTVTASQTAYINAGGIKSDAVYADASSAKAALQSAILAKPQIKTDIELKKASLEQALSAIAAAKDTVAAETAASIQSAKELLLSSTASLSAYYDLGGLKTDTVYTEVTVAAAAVQKAIAATPKTKAVIETQCGILSQKLTLLDEAASKISAALSAAVEQAALLTTTAFEAQAEYISYGGKSSDPVYTAVTLAVTALKTAVAAKPQKLTLITNASSLLSSKIQLLTAASDTLAQRLSAPEQKVAALEAAISLDLTEEANLLAAEALVADADTAIKAVSSIPASKALSDRLSAAKALLAAARKTFDSTTGRLLSSLGTGSAGSYINDSETYCIYTDELMVKYIVGIKKSKLPSSFIAGSTSFRVIIGDKSYPLSVNFFNNDLLTAKIDFQIRFTPEQLSAARLVATY